MTWFLGADHAKTEPDHPDPALRDRVVPLNRAAVIRLLKTAVAEMEDWRIDRIDHTVGSVGLSRPSFFRWAASDLSVTVIEEGDRCRIKVYAQSRHWSYDFGTNRRLIMQLFRTFDDALVAERAGERITAEPPGTERLG